MRNKLVAIFALVGLLSATSAALGEDGGGSFTPPKKQNQAPAAKTGSPPTGIVAERCVPLNVAVFDGSRLHVQCALADYNIAYFAYPITSTNPEQVRRLLDVALTAIKTPNAYLYIYTDYFDLSGQAFGCFNGDCRKINAMSVNLDR